MRELAYNLQLFHDSFNKKWQQKQVQQNRLESRLEFF